ncbi:hypothetical protein SUGI_1076990 [Cryptomeria japonica]|nr:hypothetical protein SUGI_1076990 [Cryptomeria japonica]
MWKPHPGLLKTVEIRSPEGLWRQEIAVEEIMVKCKSCKEWGHEDYDCKARPKGKGRANRALEEQLLAGSEVTKQLLGHIEANLSFDPAASLARSLEDLGGMKLLSDSCPAQEVLQMVSGPTEDKVVAVVNVVLGEIYVDHPQIMSGSTIGDHAQQAFSEGCGDVCLHTGEAIVKVDQGLCTHECAFGRGISSQHRFYSTSESGLEGLEKGLNVKPLVNQFSDDIAGSSEGKASSFKDIHMPLGKVHNGFPVELEFDEEDGLNDDSLGLSAEIGERDVRTIKQTKTNPSKYHFVPWVWGTQIRGHVFLRVQKLNVCCETKIKDNVL